jgi:hypothetical protein
MIDGRIMKLDRTIVEVETSFADAERKTRQRYLEMTSEERIQVVESLRKLTYPNGVAPSLQNIVKCIQR